MAELSPRTSRRRERESTIAEIQSAEATFHPADLTLLQAKPYEKAAAKAAVQVMMMHDVHAMHSIEDEFGLRRHTLALYLTWKKKQPVQLTGGKSAAERQAAARRKQQQDVLEKQKAWEQDRERAKFAAATAIALQYKTNLNDMVLEAAREAVAGLTEAVVGMKPLTLPESAKLVRLLCFTCLNDAECMHRLRQPWMNMATTSTTHCVHERS
jgi:hypothetical protein